MRTTLALLLLLTLPGACAQSDPRLERLTTGISKDSATAVMGDTAARADRYLVGGRFIEALYFARPEADVADVGDRAMSPVILINDSVAAWGWTRWDAIAREHNIPVAPQR